MPSSIDQLNSRLQQHQLQALLDDYTNLATDMQATQLQHLYKLAANSEIKYLYLQNVATLLLNKVSLPYELVPFFDDLEKLSFFTPGLKFHNAFSITDSQSNTLLHYLFSHCQANKLPFNYLRSLLLFESNESLAAALQTLNQQQLSPIGCFIAQSSTTSMLPKHEFSALLAMMEVDQQHAASAANALIKQLKCFYQHTQPHVTDCKVLLCAAYLQMPTSKLVTVLTQ